MTPEQLERMASQRAALADQLQIHLTGKPEDDGTKKAAKSLKRWESDGKGLEALIQHADHYLSASEHEAPVDVPADDVDKWAQNGTMVATIPKGHRAQLRVSLNEWQGRQTIDLRLWFEPKGGGAWGPSRKGVSIQAAKLDALIAGLMQAREQAKAA